MSVFCGIRGRCGRFWWGVGRVVGLLSLRAQLLFGWAAGVLRGAGGVLGAHMLYWR